MDNCNTCQKILDLRTTYQSCIEKKDYICKICFKQRQKKRYLIKGEELRKISKEKSRLKRAENNPRFNASQRLGQHRYFDKRKNLPLCNISLNEYINITAKPCEYCNDTVEQRGLDRIDNKVGHLKSNVVSCCTTCNTARMSTFSHEEMKLLGETIKKIKEKRSGSKHF